MIEGEKAAQQQIDAQTMALVEKPEKEVERSIETDEPGGRQVFHALQVGMGMSVAAMVA